MVCKSQDVGYSSIEHLAKNAWLSGDWKEVTLSMLTAAFDASGHEADQLCLVVAGFASSASDWREFDREWKKRLSEDGLVYFHMVEFAQFAKQFKDWRGQEERRKKLLGDLLKIISTYTYRKFGAIIVNSTFQGRLSQQVRDAFRLNAYSLAGRSCVADVNRWWVERERIKTPPVEHVFEDGDIGKGRLMERMSRDGYPTPDFRRKKDSYTPEGILIPAFTPLQAADFLAYELFEGTKKIETDGSVDNLRWPLQEFLSMTGEPGIYEEEDLDRMGMMLNISCEVERLARVLGTPKTKEPH
jgi:hypothetical protein